MLRKILWLSVITVTSLMYLQYCPAYAFLEDTPQKIERNIQSLITSAKNGSSVSNQKLAAELEEYQNLDLNNHSSSEIISRVKSIRNFPSYVFERGSYTYNTGANYFYIKGRNINMYSVPIIDSAVLITKLNTSGIDYLVYLGEWKPQKGSSWIFAEMPASHTTGWLEKRNTEPVTNYTFRQIISDIHEGLQGYQLTTVRNTQRNSEAVNSDAINYSSFTREMGRKITNDIRSARAGNITARRNLDDTLRTLSSMLRSDLAKKSWSENDAYVQKLIHNKKIDGKFLRAGYKYDESGVILYTPEFAVIRSEPDSNANKIASTRAGQSLRYLGERITKSGVKFYLADDMKGNAGWLSERVTQVIPVDAVRAFKAQIEEGTASQRR